MALTLSSATRVLRCVCEAVDDELHLYSISRSETFEEPEVHVYFTVLLWKTLAITITIVRIGENDITSGRVSMPAYPAYIIVSPLKLMGCIVPIKSHFRRLRVVLEIRKERIWVAREVQIWITSVAPSSKLDVNLIGSISTCRRVREKSKHHILIETAVRRCHRSFNLPVECPVLVVSCSIYFWAEPFGPDLSYLEMQPTI